MSYFNEYFSSYFAGYFGDISPPVVIEQFWQALGSGHLIKKRKRLHRKRIKYIIKAKEYPDYTQYIARYDEEIAAIDRQIAAIQRKRRDEEDLLILFA